MAVVSPIAKYKLVFLGDQSVGKTNIITRFMYDKFDTTYLATIGIDFLSKTMYREDRTVRLQLWDTTGQERFRSQIPSYIRDSSVAVIVYDVANRQSFLNTAKWIDEVRTERGTDVIIVLVGNKTDLDDKRQVSLEEGDGKAREFGVMFIETSAKSGFNIKPIFRRIFGALPGMETLSSTKEEDMVDLNLKSSGMSHAGESSCGAGAPRKRRRGPAAGQGVPPTDTLEAQVMMGARQCKVPRHEPPHPCYPIHERPPVPATIETLRDQIFDRLDQQDAFIRAVMAHKGMPVSDFFQLPDTGDGDGDEE